MTANLEDPDSYEEGSEPGAGLSLPDVVPDELISRFGRRARHTVRYHQSKRYRLRRGFVSQLSSLRLTDVWMTAAVVFGCSLVGLALIGALAYAVVLWPLAVLFLVVPVVILMPLSLWVAVKITRKERASQPLSFGS
jgi:hypothetical protein